jgi:hypothetical protein
MAENLLESIQRWTAKRRSALIVSILKGETSLQAAARSHGLTVAEIEACAGDQRTHVEPDLSKGSGSDRYRSHYLCRNVRVDTERLASDQNAVIIVRGCRRLASGRPDWSGMDHRGGKFFVR